jgi:hypothetical protein
VHKHGRAVLSPASAAQFQVEVRDLDTRCAAPSD